MKRLRQCFLCLLMISAPLQAGDALYRLEYQIRGAAISRLLLVFPLRIYYEAAAGVDLVARQQPDGGTRFSYAGIPGPAYVLRTLGFSGKTLALLIVNDQDVNVSLFAADLLSRWQKSAPEFSERTKTIKKFPHQLVAMGPQSFAFERDRAGFYRNFSVGLEARYLFHPAKTGIFFNVFPTLAEFLKLLNHRFTPGLAGTPFGPFPAEWTGDDIDFSGNLNQVAALLEKVVKSMVTVQQRAPLRLHFRVTASSAEETEICGESFPDVPLWKGFMIKEVFRRLRLRPVDRVLLADELWVGIRNNKSQGGFGRLHLRRIDPGEEKK